MRSWLACLILLALVGCTSTHAGRPIHPENVPPIEIGVTTEDDIRAQLGAPTRLERRANGTGLMYYESVEIEAHDTEKLGEVICWLVSVGLATECYGLPWNVRHETETRRALEIELAADATVSDYTYIHEELPATIVYARPR